MATCWHCDSFAEDARATCEFCGVPRLGSKPKWIAALDALPASQGDETPRFGVWYLIWEFILAALGLWYWPWWAALGAVFVGLLAALPATMATVVLLQQLSRLWLAARARLLRPSRRNSLFDREQQTTVRLAEDQEAFDTLVGIIQREHRHRDLMPEAYVVEYRQSKVLPVFSKMVRLSASALLEMEVRRLINKCEQICQDAGNCDHQEFDRRFERLDAMQRELGVIKKRWTGYLTERIAVPEYAANPRPSDDSFTPRLPPDAVLLSPEDLTRLGGAHDTVRQLRHALHQTQELRLLRAAKPLVAQEANTGLPPDAALSGMSVRLREIQRADRLGELEREYQRIAAEQRTIRDTSPLTLTPPPVRAERQNRIDAPPILSK